MMIKRILCFILAICVFGTCIIGMGTAVAASPADSSEAYAVAAELLSALEIFGEDEQVLDVTNVSRAEFCGYAAEIFSLPTDAAPIGYYKDVNAETLNAGAIEALFTANVLSPADDGRFEPERNITMDEAIKILLAASGYQERAVVTGGIFTGYYKLAQKLDLLDNLAYEGSRPIKKGEAAILLKNLLRMEIYDIVSITYDEKGNVNLGKDTGETVIEKYYNIRYFEGVVTANRYTSLLSPDGVGEGMVMVEDMLLEAGKTEISKWLGYNTEVYYEIDDEKVIHFDVSDKNEVVTVEAIDNPEWKDGKVCYYTKNGNKAEKSVPADATIIYNNLAVEVFKSEYFDIDSGEVELIDADGRNGFETVIIRDYQTVVVNTFNEDFRIISSKNNVPAVNLADKEYEIYDDKGNRINESYVTEWDVLSILQPDGNGVVVIYKTRKQVSGKITSIFDDYIMLDGTKYYVTKEFIEVNKATLKPGARGVLYLDIMGSVAAFRLQDEDSGIAYIMTWAKPGALDDTLAIKMLLYNPSDSKEMIYVFKTNEKIKVDGNSIESGELSTYLDGIKNKGSELIVNYKVNEEGLLSELDTVLLGEKEDPDYSLVLDYKADATETKSMVYQPSSRIFSGKVAMAEDAIVFYVPEEEGSSDSDYGAVKLKLSNKEGWNPFTTYKIGADKMTADALIFRQAYKTAGGSFGTYDRMAYINGVWEAWDEENEETSYMIGYYYGGTYYERKVWKTEVLDKTIVDNTDPENVITTVRRLQDGDLVLISTNSEGDVDDYRLLYDFPKKQVASPVTAGGNYNNASYNAKHRAYVGYVYEIEGDTVALSDTNPAELVKAAQEALKGTYGDNIPASVLKTEVLKSCFKFNLPSGVRIYETDRETGWNSCSADDILPYILYGDECSKLLVHTTYSYAYDAAVVE